MESVRSTHDYENDDVTFWSNFYLPRFELLLKESGSYEPAEVEHYVTFLESLIPLLGPSPQPRDKKPPTDSQCTYNCMPLEFSMNFSDNKPPIVRFILEPLGQDVHDLQALHGKYEECLVAMLDQMPSEWRDSTWLRALDDAFTIRTPTEQLKLRERLPPHVPRLTRGYFGIDLGSGRNRTTTNVKPYWTPVGKALASLPDALVDIADDKKQGGQEFVARKTLAAGFARARLLTFQSVRDLNDGLVPAVETLERYVAHECKIPTPGLEFIFTGVDCAPTDDARVKIYFRCANNAFASVKDAVSLGGRYGDEAVSTFLNELREIWHLLRCDGMPGDLSEDFSKSVLHPKHRMNGLCVGYEIRAGRSRPEVKLYVPMFQFHRDDMSAVRAMESICELKGWDFKQGRYEQMIQKVFLVEDLTMTNIHTYASFQYSKASGVYMTMYYSPLPTATD